MPGLSNRSSLPLSAVSTVFELCFRQASLLDSDRMVEMSMPSDPDDDSDEGSSLIGEGIICFGDWRDSSRTERLCATLRPFSILVTHAISVEGMNFLGGDGTGVMGVGALGRSIITVLHGGDALSELCLHAEFNSPAEVFTGGTGGRIFGAGGVDARLCGSNASLGLVPSLTTVRADAILVFDAHEKSAAGKSIGGTASQPHLQRLRSRVGLCPVLGFDLWAPAGWDGAGPFARRTVQI